jgi:hypothetical protein
MVGSSKYYSHQKRRLVSGAMGRFLRARKLPKRRRVNKAVNGVAGRMWNGRIPQR